MSNSSIFTHHIYHSHFVNHTAHTDVYVNLLQAEIWLSVTLSSISFIALIFFWIVYALAQVRARDRAKFTRRRALRNLCMHEYLVLSYSSVLAGAHLVNVMQETMQFLHLVDVDAHIHNITTYRWPCLVMAVMKHWFWLLAVLHCAVISYKLFVKATRTSNAIVLDRNNKRQRHIWKTLTFIILLATSLVIISICIHFSDKSLDVYYVYYLPPSTILNTTNTTYLDSIKDICFLRQPLFLLVVFVLPITIVFIFDLVIFMVLFFKTRDALQNLQNQNQDDQPSTVTTIATNAATASTTKALTDIEKNGNGDDRRQYLFLKLSILMGLPWIVYIVSMSLAQIPKDTIILIFHLVAGLQINSQGFLLALVLYSNASSEKLFSPNRNKFKKKVKICPIEKRLTIL